MGKGLHKVFKTVVKKISQELPRLEEFGPEVSYFITEPRNFAEVKKLSDDIKKPRLKSTLNEIKNLINNKIFLGEDPEKYEPLTKCVDVYKVKIQSDGILDKLKMRIVIRGYLYNKELTEDNWSPTAYTSTLKYFLADETEHKARLHQLDFIGAFLQAKVKNRVFVKFDSRYIDYFPEYSN